MRLEGAMRKSADLCFPLVQDSVQHIIVLPKYRCPERLQTSGCGFLDCLIVQSVTLGHKRGIELQLVFVFAIFATSQIIATGIPSNVEHPFFLQVCQQVVGKTHVLESKSRAFP